MSRATPMSIHERVKHYVAMNRGGALTAKQRRRARKKDNQSPLVSMTADQQLLALFEDDDFEDNQT